jgi:hypothetical protein
MQFLDVYLVHRIIFHFLNNNEKPFSFLLLGSFLYNAIINYFNNIRFKRME